MLTGTALIPFLTTPFQTWTALLFLLFIHLSTNHRAVRAVSLRTLNRQRASILFELFNTHSPPHSNSSIPEISFPTILPTPTELSRCESIIHPRPSSLHVYTLTPPLAAGELYRRHPEVYARTPASASFVPISALASHLPILLPIFAAEDYILSFDARTLHARIALKLFATPRTALKAWLCARECALAAAGGVWSEEKMRECVKSVAASWEGIVGGLVEAGWNVDVNDLETRKGTRFQLWMQQKKDV
jgi:hypothetical protein